MCGITGLWNFASADISQEAFSAFNDSLAHRGPDGSGIEHFPEDRLWLGHRRLAILDLSSRARQPMSYADGRYWLTYNGEIYNYVELRESLRQLGHRFVSESDSEVILAAYAEWGPACQTRFNGMWALAIWDESRKVLFLSRDRFGIKPLHYSLYDGTFAFASELKAFLALDAFDGSFDPEILAETLININGQEDTEHTLLPKVKRLSGGHCMTVTAGDAVRVERWWNTLDHLPQVPADFAAQVRDVREMFFDSCRLRLRSDVPIATSLSGGLDSSAVACTVAMLGRDGTPDHLPADWQRAFVACFPGTNLDEERYARQVVKHTGMVPHYFVVDDVEALKHFEDILFSFEAIYWVPLVGPWSIYREMRSGGIRVSLDGHGADELLGGYHFFVEREIEALLTSAFRLGRYIDLKKVLAGMVGGSAEDLRVGLAGDFRLLARHYLRQLGLAGTVPRLSVAIGRLLGPAQATPLGLLLRPYGGPKRLYNEMADRRYDNMSALGRGLYTWFHHSVLPTILRSYDRASMAHGIEVRMPFMDWRLVTYCFALPDESKVGRGYTKRVLREAMCGVMPEPIRLRTNKIGFTTPLNQWMRGALKTWLLDTINSRRFLESDIWFGETVRATVEQWAEGHGGLNVVWPILNAYVLQERFRAVGSNKSVRSAA